MKPASLPPASPGPSGRGEGGLADTVNVARRGAMAPSGAKDSFDKATLWRAVPV